MTPEGYSKQAVRKVLDRYKQYLWYFLPAANGYGMTGIPDVIICCCGLFVTVECKAKNGVISPLQDMQMTGIRNARGMTLVVWDRDTLELENLITNIVYQQNAPATHQSN